MTDEEFNAAHLAVVGKVNDTAGVVGALLLIARVMHDGFADVERAVYSVEDMVSAVHDSMPTKAR